MNQVRLLFEELVLDKLFAQRVAVEAQPLRRAGLVAFAATVPVMALFFNGWQAFYNNALIRTVGAMSLAGAR